MRTLFNPKIHFLFRVICFIYLVSSFINWDFNPGHWDWFDRFLGIAIFLWTANDLDDETSNINNN